MRLIAALLCAILFAYGGAARAADDASRGATSPIPKEWLQKIITVAEAEAAYPGITDDRAQRFPDAAKPFGFENGEWEALKAQMLPGDELWTFASPAESWQHLAGRSGIALVRDGNPVKVLLGAMN
jgi:hypothetical protein